MGLGRLLKRKIDGEETLEDVVDAQLKKRDTYSFDNVKEALSKLKDYSDREFVDEDKFQKLFFDFWVEMFSDRARSTNKIHASSLMDDCSRKVFYDLSKTPPSDKVASGISGRLQRIFDAGTWLHVYFQVLLWQAGILIESEVAVKSRRKRLDSRSDGIIVWQGKRLNLEIKTMNSFSYRKGVIGVFDKHKYQSNLYASELGLDGNCYLYINKDTSEIKFHITGIDKHYVDMANEKIDHIIEHVKKKEAPERRCRIVTSEFAKKCPYRTLCFKD